MEANEMDQVILGDPLLPNEESKKRIIPVLLSPLADDELGAFKSDFCHWAYRGKGKTDWELLEPNTKQGRSMIRNVAIALKELLESIYGCNGPLYGHKGKIYLSSSPDVDVFRRGIQITFRDHGYPVVPDVIALPGNQPAFDSAVRKFLSESRASVHALGANASDDAGFIMHHREFELSKCACEDQSLKRCIVWIPKNWTSTSPIQQEFVARLRQGDPMPENVQLHQVTFQTLKEIIRHECLRLESLPPAPAPADAKHRVYLVHREYDHGHNDTQALEAWMKTRNLTVLKPLFVGHPAEKRRQHDTACQTAHAAIVYCGEKSAEWASQQFLALKNAPFAPQRLLFYLSGGHGNFSPLEGSGLLVKPDAQGGISSALAQLNLLFPEQIL